MNEQKMTRQGALRRALPILIITIIGAVIIGLLAIRSARNFNTLGPNSTELSFLAVVCEGSGFPSAAVFDRQTRTHPALIARESQDGWVIDLEPIPAEYRPEVIGEVQLVLCVSSPKTVNITRCESEDTIYLAQMAVRLVSARTGATVDDAVLGPIPGECLPEGETEPAGASNPVVWEWLRPYVTGGSN